MYYVYVVSLHIDSTESMIGGCITENLSKAVMWSFSVIDLITKVLATLNNFDSSKFHEEDF